MPESVFLFTAWDGLRYTIPSARTDRHSKPRFAHYLQEREAGIGIGIFASMLRGFVGNWQADV